MRISFDIITILGFVLTVLGTYLTIRSGDGEIIIKDEFLRYGFIIIIVLSYIAYNYCRKYHIAKSVFKGRSKMIEVFSKSIELGEVLRNGKPSLNSYIEKGGESLSKYHALCKDDQSFKKMISIIKTHVLCKRGRNINQIIDEIEMLNKDS